MQLDPHIYCAQAANPPARVVLPSPLIRQAESRTAIEHLAARIDGQLVLLNSADSEVAQYVAMPSDRVM